MVGLAKKGLNWDIINFLVNDNEVISNQWQRKLHGAFYIHTQLC